MSVQAMFQEPTVPGLVDGIICRDPLTLQCRDCGVVVVNENPTRRVGAFITLSGFHFCPHEAEPKRRCPECLAVVRAACQVCTSLHVT